MEFTNIKFLFSWFYKMNNVEKVLCRYRYCKPSTIKALILKKVKSGQLY